MGLQDISKNEQSGKLPSDIYNVVCKDVELTTTKKNNDPMFALSLEISNNPEVQIGINEDGTPQMKDPNGRSLNNWVPLGENSKLLDFASIVEQAGLDLFGSVKKEEDIIPIMRDNMSDIAQAIKGHTFSAKVSFKEKPEVNQVTKEPILNPVTQEPMISVQSNVGIMFAAQRQ